MEDLYVREVTSLGSRNIRLVRNDGMQVQGPATMYPELERKLMAMEFSGYVKTEGGSGWRVCKGYEGRFTT